MKKYYKRISDFNVPYGLPYRVQVTKIRDNHPQKKYDKNMATPELMIQPSFLMRSGLQIRQLDEVILFKFTDELHCRLEQLLEKSKAELLTPDEAAELAGIKELDRIFTLINSKIAAQAKWSRSKLEARSDNEQEIDVSTATPLNL